MKNILIQNRRIGYNEPVCIIAEAGVNHNGKLDLALKLVDAAASAGADAVKFQTFRAEQVVTESGEMVEYQKKNLGKVESQIEMLRKLEFDESWYPQVIANCKKMGIIFLSTPHGSFASVDLLKDFSVPAFKFGSGDLTSLPLLTYAAKLGKPMILGTGMATMAEVKEAVKTIKKAGGDKIIVLHCTTNYPCPSEEINLRAMQTMMKELNVLVGYSDHTNGSQVAVMATSLGACVIEKHLTLDNNLPGPDHRTSSNRIDFKKMVDEVRAVNIILGSAIKKPTESEKKLLVIRRSIVAVRDIKKGERFTRNNLDIKRPANGLAPKYFDKVLGKRAKKYIKRGTLLNRNLI